MSAPALSIPVRANLDAFKRQMEETSSLARTATRKAAQAFLDMNKDLAGSAATAAFSGMAANALRLAGRIALVVGAAKLMGDAIGAARDQLKDMVELQNKAQNVGVSSSFFQKFGAEARKLQIDTADLEGALTHAFNATKDKSPIDLGAWDTGKDRITEVERALRIYNETLAKSAGQQLQGLVLFRDADTQEKKVEAVLKAMIQLDQIGQRAASLDLGEKMFGSAFVDRIRQGRTSAESMLSTIQKASGDADGIFPDALVRRAKEMDDQLKVAHQRLSTALKPSWDDLADGLLTMKGYWATIVNLIARAAELSNGIKIPGYSSASLEDKQAEYQKVKDALDGNGSGIYGAIRLPALSIPGVGKVFDSSEEKMRARLEQLQREIATDAKGAQYGPFLPSQSRGTGDRPTPKPTDANRFDSSVDTIEKRTASLQGEASAYDLGTAAREKARIEAQLLAVAVQANTAAGKADTAATAEQRKTIEEVSLAYADAALAVEKAKVASQIKFGQQTSLLDPQDAAIAQQLKNIYPDVATALGSVEAQAMRSNEALRGISGTMSSTMTTGLTDILDSTKSVGDGFRDMSKAIIRALEEAIIKMMVVAPIMRVLQSLAGGFLGSSGAMSFGGDLGAGTGGMAFPSFDRGGYTGSGGKYQPKGVVHAGEVVWSQRDVARAGGVGVVEAMRLGYRGYADGGVAPPVPALAPSAAARNSASTPSVSFGDININVPAGTDLNNPGELARSIRGMVAHVVAEKIAQELRPRGALNRMM